MKSGIILIIMTFESVFKVIIVANITHLILFDDDDSFKDPVELAMFVHAFICMEFDSGVGIDARLLPESKFLEYATKNIYKKYHRQNH